MKILALTLMLLLSMGPRIGVADVGEDAIEYYNRKDYQAAYDLWKPLAENGIAEAQFRIGFLYYKGRGVKKDFEEAAVWFRKAMKQGHFLAQMHLGFLKGKILDNPQDETR